MPAPNPARRRLVAAAAGLVLGGALIAFGALGPFQNKSDAPAPAPARTNQTVGVPKRLQIPKIKVNARIERTGINRKLEMGVPKDPHHAAWYAYGPRPGQKGSAVIDGHFDWDNGTPAIFDNLDKLRPGDKVMVTDARGQTFSFMVRKTRTYRREADSTRVFRSRDGKAHLNLITCTGIWNQKRNSYSERLVVFTDRK